jgi:hypothetical protein
MPSKSYTRELPVVIVSYNTKDLLRECLQSVHRETTGLNTETLQKPCSSTTVPGTVLR